MKKIRRPRLKLSGLIAISGIALTALSLGQASSRSDDVLNAESVSLSETFLSNREFDFLESAAKHGSISEYLRSTWKEKFDFTENGGLNAKNPYCERFLGSDGKYGNYGKIVSDYLRSKLTLDRNTPMLSDDLIGMVESPSVCPNWRSFDSDERIRFWVWTFAAIASLESSCGADPSAMTGVAGYAPGYVAIGLLQLEKHKKHRAWRNLSTCNVSETEIAGSFSNLRCGIDIMEWLVTPNPPEKDAWPIYRVKGLPERSYWEKLRRENGGMIGELIRAYTPCRGTYAGSSTGSGTHTNGFSGIETLSRF